MQNPYFVGRPPGIYAQDGLALDEMLNRTGGNTGNLIFISTLHKIIAHATPSNHARFDVAEVKRNHDGIVVPAANWLNYYSDWGGLAKKIEETGLPCVIVGLGAQSHSLTSYPNPTPGTLRLVKVIAERCVTLSVRGEYTASALAHLGVKNVDVTGCPSLLWNMAPLKIEKTSEARTIAVSSTRSDLFEKVFDKNASFACSVFLSRLAYAKGYDYIAQTELFDMQLARSGAGAGGAITAIPDYEAKKDFVCRIFGVDSLDPLQPFLQKHMKSFFNIEDWIKYNQSRDFVFGTRLHGVITSLLSGVPAMLVEHDTRTAEMAKLIKIPSIDAKVLMDAVDNDNFDINKLYESLDFSVFNDHQPRYFKTFMDFFAKNDVRLNIAQK